MKIDLTPFCLPNTAVNEIRFEEPRDIKEILVTFKTGIPSSGIKVLYLRKTWPRVQLENIPDLDNPFYFGWVHYDDWFNVTWQKASMEIVRVADKCVRITFLPLVTEYPEQKKYNVTFRRTLGIKIDVPPHLVRKVAVYSNSPAETIRINVRLDAGKRTPGKKINFSVYNGKLSQITPGTGITIENKTQVKLNSKQPIREFKLTLTHMYPLPPYNNDRGLLTFNFDTDKFTVSLPQLLQAGPIWYPEYGVYLTDENNPVPFNVYQTQTQNKDKLTLTQQVIQKPEQSYAGAYYGQPRAHRVAYSLGCKYRRHKFWLEPNGDVLIHTFNVTRVKAEDTDRVKITGPAARLFFGLEQWQNVANFCDSPGIPIYNIHYRKDTILIKQKSFAVPLFTSILKDNDCEINSTEPVILFIRFSLRNLTDKPQTVGLPVNYSDASSRSYHSYHPGQTDSLIPQSKLNHLAVTENKIYSYPGKHLRAMYLTEMKVTAQNCGLFFSVYLPAGKTVDLTLKIPYLVLDRDSEIIALNNLDYTRGLQEVSAFWDKETSRGASLITPVSALNDLYKSHLTHVQITDSAMPDEANLINTSVGTSTYGNFSNEACMVINELDQRGLHEEARKRLTVWLKFQGTVPQPGNFTDFNGMYFGAGGMEEGAYNQHHGWVLWCIAEHFLLTQDVKWLREINGSIIAAVDWVLRQRNNTRLNLPHSRGWEYGFLPAGSLEDVTDFYYWLSTNVLTWRGVDRITEVLEITRHPEANRLRREVDGFKKELIAGFERARQYSPLVRLQNGHWVPHYPSRLYCRGRDVGWIREVLEGAVYLLISGLYSSDGKPADWILTDYQDNRYPNPPYGYQIPDFLSNWYDRAGFSMQPNLLASGIPYLYRDEPELYIWTFFNSLCACYREEINAIIEHPAPGLGYDNTAHFKTSDEANAVTWLRYMFVFTIGDHLLHFGRAIPRAWFTDSAKFGTQNVATRFGQVGISYETQRNLTRICARVNLNLTRTPKKIYVRFRHPDKKRLTRVWINQKEHFKFDLVNENVDITGFTGRVEISAEFS